ncbi:hypothetical protein BBW79_12365 [Listeria monocytogenes]|nr:hypothetical protein [Listeria monocytogenes]
MMTIKPKLHNLFKAIAVSLVTVFLINIASPVVQASSFDPFAELGKVSHEEISDISKKITEHSTVDPETGMPVLNYTIVEAGIITEDQYNEVKQVEKKINAEFAAPGKAQRLAPLIVAAIAVIKAVAIFIGVVVAEQLITYVTTWGVSSFCKAYKKKHSVIKSFCSANGF